MRISRMLRPSRFIRIGSPNVAWTLVFWPLVASALRLVTGTMIALPLALAGVSGARKPT